MANNARRDLRCAIDPVEFAREVGITPDSAQSRMLRSSSNRRLVCCTRQWGKSTCAALGAAHRAIFVPGSLVLCVAPSIRQSTLLFDKIDRFIREYPGGPYRVEDNKTQLELTNGSRVVTLPDSPDTIRGFTPTLVLVDEAAFVSDETFGALMPMLIVSRGDLVLMSSPYGKRGEFYRYWAHGGLDWERMMIKADKCPRIDQDELKKQRSEMPAWLYRQEYECEFVETMDAVFTTEQIEGVAVDGEVLEI